MASTGCGAPEFRRMTYPPDFVYVERREINTVMWSFASGVAALDRSMNPEPGRDIDLMAVAAALRELDAAAGRLPIAASTNHPMLGERAERFRRDVHLALAQVEGPEPDLGLARSVTGACLYCHNATAR